jgi:predicted Zn-dependent peptidase
MKRVLVFILIFFVSSALAQNVTLPEFERVVLDNGTVLLLSEKHDVPLIGLQAIVRGGSVTDPADRAGLAELLATVLQKGAGDRDAAEFAEASARVGGSIYARANVESLSIGAEFLARDAELMIELVSDMLMRPALAEEEFNKERDRSIGLIKSAKDGDPSGLMAPYSNSFIFGEHPYGSPASGSEASLSMMSHDELLAYYADNFGGDRLIVAVVGDFNLEAMKAHLTTLLGGWGPAASPLPVIDTPTPAKGRRVLLVDKPGATQSYFWIGNVGVGVHYANRAELNLANTVFGGRFTSMLMTELRVKSGLTYVAQSGLDRYSESGSVTIRSFTETDKTVEAIDMALEILERLRISGLDNEMIASARNYIMGQFPPTLETASSLAGMLAFLEQNELGRDYIDAYGDALGKATPVTVHNTISEVYPESDDLAFVIIGDAETIRDDIAKYGPVTEMSITEPLFKPQD